MFDKLLSKFGVASMEGGVLGLDIGKTSIKIAQISKGKKGKPVLVGADLLDIPMEAQRDEAIREELIVDIIKGAIKKAGTDAKSAITIISDPSVVVRNIELPDMSKKDLKEIIKWQVGEYIPFDVEDAIIDFAILGDKISDGEKKQKALMIAVPRSLVENHMELVAKAGLSIQVIEVIPTALLRAFVVNYPKQLDNAVALIDIGISNTNLSVILEQKIVFHRSLDLGANNIIQAIARKLRVDLGTARNFSHQYGLLPTIETDEALTTKKAISNALNEIIKEISRSFEFFHSFAYASDIRTVYISGGCAKITGITDFFKDKLRIPTKEFNPLRKINTSNWKIDTTFLQEVAPRLAVGIGLALRGVMK